MIRSDGALSLRAALRACARNGILDEIVTSLPASDVEALVHDWLVWARDDQLPPAATATGETWRTWLVLGGRGAGKTRAGAEWIRAQALGLAPLAVEPATRIALVGETLDQVRSVMIDGVSGLLAIHPPHQRPVYEATKRRLIWPNGAIAQLFSGDDPDSLRGPQFAVAWCDEIAKWRHASEAFDMLQFALRLGSSPCQVVTTTPRPLPLIKRLLADPTTVVSRSRTSDNAGNLAPDFLSEMRRRYGDSRLGRQELDGEVIEERDDALWRRDWIERLRLERPPELGRIVVAVDPPVTSGGSADACGIVVAGLGVDGRGYVLADRTVQGRQPHVWARAAVAAFHDYSADRIVAEVNQGGELVGLVLRQVEEGLPIRLVRASRGKWLRAEPVAALYAEGRVAHVGEWPDLERQMTEFGPGGLSGGRSPDRLDALVWALTELMIAPAPAPAIRPV
ncbi:MAG: DNA-packaging protein [Hyphomicrobiaceae bacterium]